MGQRRSDRTKSSATLWTIRLVIGKGFPRTDRLLCALSRPQVRSRQHGDYTTRLAGMLQHAGALGPSGRTRIPQPLLGRCYLRRVRAKAAKGKIWLSRIRRRSDDANRRRVISGSSVVDSVDAGEFSSARGSGRDVTPMARSPNQRQGREGYYCGQATVPGGSSVRAHPARSGRSQPAREGAGRARRSKFMLESHHPVVPPSRRPDTPKPVSLVKGDGGLSRRAIRRRRLEGKPQGGAAVLREPEQDHAAVFEVAPGSRSEGSRLGFAPPELRRRGPVCDWEIPAVQSLSKLAPAVTPPTPSRQKLAEALRDHLQKNPRRCPWLWPCRRRHAGQPVSGIQDVSSHPQLQPAPGQSEAPAAAVPGRASFLAERRSLKSPA